MSNEGLRRYFKGGEGTQGVTALGLHLFEANTLCISKFKKILQLNMLAQEACRALPQDITSGDDGSFQRKKYQPPKTKVQPLRTRVQSPSNP